MSDAIKSVAKAIAALIVPFAVYGVDRLASAAGMPTPDPAIATAVVVAVVGFAVVWITPNGNKTTPE